VGKRDSADRERDCRDATHEGSDDGSFIDELHEYSFPEAPPPHEVKDSNLKRVLTRAAFPLFR
jgi:hypothetical protein